jgi:hypothetical protein
MNQNSFCTKCHRIPSQCVCGNTQRELTDREIMELYCMTSNNDPLEFARAILKKASEK